MIVPYSRLRTSRGLTGARLKVQFSNYTPSLAFGKTRHEEIMDHNYSSRQQQPGASDLLCRSQRLPSNREGFPPFYG